MEFALTRHAEFAIERRGISHEWIEATLRQPVSVQPNGNDPQLQHRLGRVPGFGNRVLRVVVNPNVE
ncbi:DUF4258 domain-containing protein, partial [Candidatus Sumerlaeota bacterium]|nr:DUF4258 domain-containing protein [Candidatus Sumerlaeota bacterium]